MTAVRGRGIGVDIGTGGLRIAVVDRVDNHDEIWAKHSCHWVADGDFLRPSAWLRALGASIEAIKIPDDGIPCLICVDGTSTTVFGVNAMGECVTPVIPYHDARARYESDLVTGRIPENSHFISSPSASLSKALWLANWTSQQDVPAVAYLHPSDWVMGQLSGQRNISDQNNALKLGFDPMQSQWPHWVRRLFAQVGATLPKVYRPGQVVGSMTDVWRDKLGLPRHTAVVAGTTDSLAGVLATGASKIGDAVTSLGTTLVNKVLSNNLVSSAAYGVYSHRIGDVWLTGGASNSGGGVLERYYSPDELIRLSEKIDPSSQSGLNYYPLIEKGERFPVNDPNHPSRLDPRPGKDEVFLQGMLEGIANIEKLGYERLASLGAPYPSRVVTVGGGAANATWAAIRERALGVEVVTADQADACVGAAILALGHPLAASG